MVEQSPKILANEEKAITKDRNPKRKLLICFRIFTLLIVYRHSKPNSVSDDQRMYKTS